MALLDGKQLRNTSTSLDKLNGSGLVTFTTATMSFGTGSVLTTLDANIVNGLDVVNKNYVDAVAAGLNPKEASRAIYLDDITAEAGYTYSNGTGGVGATLTFTAVTSLDTDGVTLGGTDRVIINSSTDQFVNGIYVYTNTTTLTRATDFDGNPASEVDGGEYSFVKEGTLYADTGWVVSSPDTTATIGTTTIVWTQFSSAGTIQAGDGLTKTGTTLDVGAGTGLTVSSTQISIDNTGVVSATYGAGNTIPTFNVNAQGQLTSATDVLIDITSGQINNFTASSESVIFTDANFVDGITVTFSVTSGDSVTAEVVDGSLGTSKLDTNGAGATAGYILSNDGSGNFTWVLNDVGDITEVTAGAGLTGGGTTGAITIDARAENGLNVDGTSDAVELGGALTKDTTITGGNTNNLTFGFNGNSIDVLSQFANDINISASTLGVGSIDITASNKDINISSGTTFSLSFVDGNITDSSGNGYGLVYSADYSGTFVSYSLVTKGYVDDAIAGSTTGVSDVNAGDGLVQNGTTGSVTLNVVGGTGINANPDDIEIDFPTVAGQLAGDGLVLNTDTLDVNVNADSLEIITDTVRLKDTVTGDRTFANNLTIQGDAQIDGNLTVNGTTSFIHTENLYVEDNIITLNATYSGSPIPYSGIEVNLGDGTYSTILYESSTGYWVGGVSGSESAIIQEAGTGLTKTGNTLSVDFADITAQLGGAGLTANGDVLDVGAGTGITVNADDIEVNFTEVADSLQGQGLTSSAGVINVDLSSGSGLTFSGAGDTGTLQVEVDNSTITIIDGQLVASAQGDITGVTAGAGLTGGGSSGFVTLDVNPGDGIEIVSDAVAVNLVNTDSGLEFVTGELQVDLAANSGLTLTGGLQIDETAAGDGLTFSTGVFAVNVANGLQISGDNVEVAPSIAGTGLTFSAGVLSLNPTASAVPYYGDRNLTPTTTAPNADGVDTTLTITNTPSDYSRISVYVNGQLQFLGDGVTTGDCYFDNGGGVARALTDIVAGDPLYWNGGIAGFRLTGTDRIDIIYEV